MNNFEKIKQMTVDEMAEFFLRLSEACEATKPCSECENEEWCSCDTQKKFRNWLESEVENIADGESELLPEDEIPF